MKINQTICSHYEINIIIFIIFFYILYQVNCSIWFNFILKIFNFYKRKILKNYGWIQRNVKSTPECPDLAFSTICPNWPSERRSDDQKRRGLKKGKGAKPLPLEPQREALPPYTTHEQTRALLGCALAHHFDRRPLTPPRSRRLSLFAWHTAPRT